MIIGEYMVNKIYGQAMSSFHIFYTGYTACRELWIGLSRTLQTCRSDESLLQRKTKLHVATRQRIQVMWIQKINKKNNQTH